MLVERDLQLKKLVKLADRAKGGRGGVVLLGGEAGLGKSTLLGAFLDKVGDDFRILAGGCDPLFTPRTLGPIHDMAGVLGDNIKQLLSENTKQTALFSAVLTALETPGSPTIMVIEDVHWADNATLDLIKYLGRRVWVLNTLIIVSFRTDEIGIDHPLSQVLGELPSTSTHRIELEPLSEDGVRILSDAFGYEGDDLHGITNGNPFFVTELLAGHEDGPNKIPASIKDAVASRLSRLSADDRLLLEELSLLPIAVPTGLQNALLDEDILPSLATCIANGVLIQDPGGSIRFRHELARLATLSRVSRTRQLSGHKKILSIILENGETSELGQIVHHAAGAMDSASVLKYAPLAAKQAAQAGGHRDAASHFATALRFIDDASPEDAAQLYEDWAYEAGLALRIDDEVLEARRHSITLWRALNRPDKVAQNLRWLSRLHWYRGESNEANRYSDQAIATLEEMPPSNERAMAYSLRSQLCMLNDKMDDAIAWGHRALELEKQFEDIEVRVHAFNNIGTSMVFRDQPDGIDFLKQSLALSKAHGLHEDAARVYTNLGEYGVEYRNFELAEKILTEGLAFDIEHDLDSWTHYLQGRMALLRMRQGRLLDAEAIANGVVQLESLTLLMKLPALQVLSRTRMRLGNDEALTLMTKSLADAIATDEMQHIVPARLALIEHAWLHDLPALATEHLSALLAMEKGDRHPWDTGELALWAQRYRQNLPGFELQDMPVPYALELSGDYIAAAAEWERLASPYEAALALLHVRGENADACFVKALELLQRMDAKPAIAKARSLAKSLGIGEKMPKPGRGPYKASRNHPLGLTNKEQMVLQHIVSGASNKEISEILSRSQRTVEHHVSSILSKLSASNRMGVMLRVQNEPWLLTNAKDALLAE